MTWNYLLKENINIHLFILLHSKQTSVSKNNNNSKESKYYYEGDHNFFPLLVAHDVLRGEEAFRLGLDDYDGPYLPLPWARSFRAE